MRPLFHHIAVPFIHNIIHVIDSRDKIFNKLFLTAQFRTGINCFMNGNQHFFILAVSIMVLFYEHKNIVNVDFYLPDQFNLKYDIICDIRTFLSFPFPFIPQVLITSEVILQIPLWD